jgi:hypothetical protein
MRSSHGVISSRRCLKPVGRILPEEIGLNGGHGPND